MLTLKVIHSNGDEEVYEAKKARHAANRNFIEFVDSEGHKRTVDLGRGVSAYLMNSAGSTVGCYVKCTNLETI